MKLRYESRHKRGQWKGEVYAIRGDEAGHHTDTICLATRDASKRFIIYQEDPKNQFTIELAKLYIPRYASWSTMRGAGGLLESVGKAYEEVLKQLVVPPPPEDSFGDPLPGFQTLDDVI